MLALGTQSLGERAQSRAGAHGDDGWQVARLAQRCGSEWAAVAAACSRGEARLAPVCQETTQQWYRTLDLGGAFTIGTNETSLGAVLWSGSGRGPTRPGAAQ